MAFLRKRVSGNYALSWKWKGKSYINDLAPKISLKLSRLNKTLTTNLPASETEKVLWLPNF